MTLLKKISCIQCKRQISKSNFNAHIRSCYNLTGDIFDQLRNNAVRGGTKSGSNKQIRQKQIAENLAINFELLTQTEKRKRIAFEQNEVCACCSIPNMWNDQPLKFDLDHIDGVRSNNSRANLRLICPNCHSQTTTYKVGNNKTPGYIRYSDDAIVNALRSNDSGYKAIKSLGMNPHGGNYIRIRRIIKDYNLQLSYTV